jgi:hypothetical protein
LPLHQLLGRREVTETHVDRSLDELGISIPDSAKGAPRVLRPLVPWEQQLLGIGNHARERRVPVLEHGIGINRGGLLRHSSMHAQWQHRRAAHVGFSIQTYVIANNVTRWRIRT